MPRGATPADRPSNPPAIRPRDFEAILVERSPEIGVMLAGSDVTPERFVKSTVHALARNPDLLKANRDSLLLAVLEAAEMGLEPTGQFGGAHLVPFKGRIQVITDYRGLIKMALRSGQIGAVSADLVYERDEFAYSRGTAPDVHHVPTLGPRGNPTHAYAIAWTGSPLRPLDFAVLTHAEVEAVRLRAPSGRHTDGPWITDWPAMAKKTAVRRLFNLIPVAITPQLAAALEREDLRERHVDVEAPAEPAAVQTARARLLGRLSAPTGAETPPPPESGDTAPPVASSGQQADDGLPEMAP